MYDNLVPTTEVEAVNALLEQIGEAPVSSLDDLSLDAASARNTLQRVMREVQARGWHWNTTLRKLQRNGSNEYVLPTNALKADTAGNSWHINVSVREGKLFDKRPYKNVFTFDETELEVEIVELLAFSDLPEAARQYIYVRASRQYQESNLGAPTLSSFSRDDEQLALVSVMDDEVSSGDYNMLDSTYQPLMRSPVGFRRF